VIKTLRELCETGIKCHARIAKNLRAKFIISAQSEINLQNRRRKTLENLKRFLVVISLMIMLAGTALADCPLPLPGETNAPPCTATQQLADDATNQTTTTATISTELEIFALDTVIAGLENLMTVY